MNKAIDKIHEFERFGSKLGLSRMNMILEKLGNPQKDLKVIHVAGTNGKGSICKYVYEALQAGGYKTGLYTSPFIEVFNERIQFNGEYISNEELDVYTEKVLEKSKEMVNEGNESPTEFEVVTAIAFLYFKEKNADYVVLEVGLGGRGDSTNVMEAPLATIIASISLDHTDRLGNTIAEIAAEKAGIIKVGCPVITTTDNVEALEVIENRAKELNASVYNAKKVTYVITDESIDGYSFSTEILGEQYDLKISMSGKHQIENAIGALYALTILVKEKEIVLSKESIIKGFSLAKQMGRFEILSRNPFVIIDGAHNPDGTKALKNTVNKFFDNKNILMITGILADKDVEHIIDNFISITDEFVITEPTNPRKMCAEELEKIISTKGGNCTIMKAPEDAVEYALSKKNKYDLILFAGSLYLIGEIRELLKKWLIN